MGNPLACSAALASIHLLLSSPWQQRVAMLEQELRAGLAPAAALPGVREVRALGAIGVIEMRQPVPMARLQRLLVERGVWVRPFGRLVYAMPPFVMEPQEVRALTRGMVEALHELH
jgi:adenosylmethionine-8-amino-7-oxononanoate aminotransferase